MRILLITDQEPQSQHSAIRGIFDRYMRKVAEVHIVWFSRDIDAVATDDRQTILPWRYRKWGVLWRWIPPLPLERFDVVIVRNLFPVLRGLSNSPRRFRLGFWESFPHSFRRLHEAEQTNRSRFRKRIEYGLRSRREKHLLTACDFYLPITRQFADSFRPNLGIPTHPLPMGIDVDQLPPKASIEPGDGSPLRLIYAGAVDRLRGFAVILNALKASKQNYILDIYTADQNEIVDAILQGVDTRLHVFKAIPRAALLEHMRNYDVGLALIPPDPLYEVASPTKTMEYYSMGLPALMTPLPEHLYLFNEEMGFFCSFEEEAITRSIDQLCQTPRNALIQMGEKGRERILAKRSYECLALELFSFINGRLELSEAI